MTRKSLTLAVVGLAAVAVAVFVAHSVAGRSPRTEAAGGIVVPDLSMRARIGEAAYDSVCAECHGANATGTDRGPPLVHPIYNPGHHADESFFRAARFGVRAHHWRFGDMPAQPDVDERKVAAIVVYVRELQRANGIVHQEHRM